MTEPLDPSLSFAQFLETHAETAETPVVRDEDWANAKLAKLASLQNQIRTNHEFATRQHDRIEDWESEVNGPLQREAEEIDLALQDYTLDLRITYGKATVRLPNGLLKTASKQKVWTFSDEFTEWAKDNRPDLVKTSYTVDKRAAKEAFLIDSDGHALDPQSGEMVPGLTQAEPEAPYSITVTPKEK